MPSASLAEQFDAFLMELPYPGQPSGGKHVAVVLSTARFHAATGRVLVAGLTRPKEHQRYPSHVVVAPAAFQPMGAGQRLTEERVMQLDQARTMPAPHRRDRIGSVDPGVWNGRACPDGYGLETAFFVHFQIEGYLRRRARHGAVMRPVEAPGTPFPRGSVWGVEGRADRRLVAVSNERSNQISDYVQALEVGTERSPESAEVRVLPSGAGGQPQAASLLPILRTLEKHGLRQAGRVASDDIGKLDGILLAMIED
jgi:mRNA-degrading endonuclease toxin of MazEF toxin-antitoxin module